MKKVLFYDKVVQFTNGEETVVIPKENYGQVMQMICDMLNEYLKEGSDCKCQCQK